MNSKPNASGLNNTVPQYELSFQIFRSSQIKKRMKTHIFFIKNKESIKPEIGRIPGELK